MNRAFLFRFTVVVLLLTGFMAPRTPLAQAVTATGTSSAQLVVPLTILEKRSIDFGDFVVGALNGGTMTISPEQFPSKTPGGTVVLLDPSSAGSGGFLVAGTPNMAFNTGGSDFAVTLLGTSGLAQTLAATMEATLNYRSFTGGGAITGAGGGLLNGSGQDAIFVGGTLTVSAAQTPGDYKGTYNFTVNY